MIVREATSDDVGAIVALGEAVVPATYAPLGEAFAAWQLERWWSEAAVRAGLDRLPHWVADDDGVLGVANLGEHDGLPAMWKLYVHPDHHGRGIGTALLGAVETAAADAGVLTLEHVGGNDRAARFYASHRFVETGRSSFEAFPDLDWIWMRKELA